MNCRDWEERIALYAGGDLPPVEAAEVERHVADCAGCQVLLSGLRQSLELLREAHGEPVDPAHFAAVRARVLAKLERECRPWWRQAWAVGPAMAALVLLVALWPKPSPRPPVMAQTREAAHPSSDGARAPDPAAAPVPPPVSASVSAPRASVAASGQTPRRAAQAGSRPSAFSARQEPRGGDNGASPGPAGAIARAGDVHQQSPGVEPVPEDSRSSALSATRGPRGGDHGSNPDTAGITAGAGDNQQPPPAVEPVPEDSRSSALSATRESRGGDNGANPGAAGAIAGAGDDQQRSPGVEPAAEDSRPSALSATREPRGGDHGANPGAAGAIAGAGDDQRRPPAVEPAARETVAALTEPLMVKLLTDDPNVVIYWISGSKGE